HGGAMRRNHHAKSERRQARIDIAQALFGRAGAVPNCEHAENFREILDQDFGAELVQIEFSTSVTAKVRGISRKKPPPSACGASVTKKSAMIFPCGVSSAQNRAVPGAMPSTSAVTSPCRNLRASSPITLMTPRSGRRAAFINYAYAGSARIARQPSLRPCARGRPNLHPRTKLAY